MPTSPATSTRRRKPALAAVLLLAAVAAFTVVIAQDGSDPTLTVSNSTDWGQYLATPDGMSVYLYTLDEGGVIACVDACTNNWQPLLADGADLSVPEGASADLIGTVERPDGSLQVTYAGWPLYTFARDREPGHVRGQALGGQFYLVSIAGTAIVDKQAEQVVDIDPAVLDEMLATGGLLFTSHCSVCHGPQGQGGIGPNLAGNSIVGDKQFIIRRILEGFAEHGMPPFASALDDHQLASVATFVRSSWGNEFSPILPEEVTPYR